MASGQNYILLMCMDEVLFREVTHDTANMSNHVEHSVNMTWPEFGIGYISVGIAERLI